MKRIRVRALAALVAFAAPQRTRRVVAEAVSCAADDERLMTGITLTDAQKRRSTRSRVSADAAVHARAPPDSGERMK